MKESLATEHKGMDAFEKGQKIWPEHHRGEEWDAEQGSDVMINRDHEDICTRAGNEEYKESRAANRKVMTRTELEV